MLNLRVLFCVNLLLFTSYSQSTSSVDDSRPDSNTFQDDYPSNRARKLNGIKYGMTFGVSGFTPYGEEIIGVSCHGTPAVPTYPPWNSPSGSCNTIQGDTPCNHTMPILCIKKCGFKRPCFKLLGSSHAMPKEYYAGWSEGFIAISHPVLGTSLTSKSAADQICASRFGYGFEMAEFHDGKYIEGMDENNYCLDTWVSERAYGGGWGFYSFGIKGSSWTRFWVYINDKSANCWN